MFSRQDQDLLERKGISKSQIESQLGYFKTGFPFLPIVTAASVGNGIVKIKKEEEAFYLEKWQAFLESDKAAVKFVPASGAASRMFKDLFAFLEASYEAPSTDAEKTFFDRIKQFAFFCSLDDKCRTLYGKDVETLRSKLRYKDIALALLSPEGLDYGNLPKGLLLFHSYHEGNRTAVGEHLTEGALYAKDKNGNVAIHFTVSEEHQPLFELLISARKLGYEIKLGCSFSISFSVQKPSTDTIAVDLNNDLFREEDGSLLFRPGGHGALIENLNDINADVIFIKNVDNVIPDRLKENEAYYKKLLAGMLVTMQERAFGYL